MSAEDIGDALEQVQEQKESLEQVQRKCDRDPLLSTLNPQMRRRPAAPG